MSRTDAFSELIGEAGEELLDFLDALDGTIGLEEVSSPGNRVDTDVTIPKRSPIKFHNTPARKSHRMSSRGHHPTRSTSSGWSVVCKTAGGSGAHKGCQIKYRCSTW